MKRVLLLLGLAAIINLLLFIIVTLFSFNPLQLIIVWGIKLLLIPLGVRIIIRAVEGGFELSTGSGIMGLYQSFYELLTLCSLTIAIYWGKIPAMAKKLGGIAVIWLVFYTFLYAITIFLLENGRSAALLLWLISMHTEGGLLFVFLLIWYGLNRKRINELVQMSEVN